LNHTVELAYIPLRKEMTCEIFCITCVIISQMKWTYKRHERDMHVISFLREHYFERVQGMGLSH